MTHLPELDQYLVDRIEAMCLGQPYTPGLLTAVTAVLVCEGLARAGADVPYALDPNARDQIVRVLLRSRTIDPGPGLAGPPEVRSRDEEVEACHTAVLHSHVPNAIATGARWKAAPSPSFYRPDPHGPLTQVRSVTAIALFQTCLRMRRMNPPLPLDYCGLWYDGFRYHDNPEVLARNGAPPERWVRTVHYRTVASEPRISVDSRDGRVRLYRRSEGGKELFLDIPREELTSMILALESAQTRPPRKELVVP